VSADSGTGNTGIREVDRVVSGRGVGQNEGNDELLVAGVAHFCEFCVYRGVFGGGRLVYWIEVRQEMKRLVEGFIYVSTRVWLQCLSNNDLVASKQVEQ